ncbi:hypothetical protein FB451DRAFT_1454498 [Mycena latifolia]|nr:hypothetical protein FB451DRAFT_1454498 [Mycena latifolia]
MMSILANPPLAPAPAPETAALPVNADEQDRDILAYSTRSRAQKRGNRVLVPFNADPRALPAPAPCLAWLTVRYVSFQSCFYEAKAHLEEKQIRTGPANILPGQVPKQQKLGIRPGTHVPTNTRAKYLKHDGILAVMGMVKLAKGSGLHTPSDADFDILTIFHQYLRLLQHPLDQSSTGWVSRGSQVSCGQNEQQKSRNDEAVVEKKAADQ